MNIMPTPPPIGAGTSSRPAPPAPAAALTLAKARAGLRTIAVRVLALLHTYPLVWALAVAGEWQLLAHHRTDAAITVGAAFAAGTYDLATTWRTTHQAATGRGDAGTGGAAGGGLAYFGATQPAWHMAWAKDVNTGDLIGIDVTDGVNPRVVAYRVYDVITKTIDHDEHPLQQVINTDPMVMRLFLLGAVDGIEHYGGAQSLHVPEHHGLRIAVDVPEHLSDTGPGGAGTGRGWT